MGSVSRFTFRIVFWEMILFSVGLMFLPRPSVLLLMMYSAFFGLIWDAITRDETREITQGVVGLLGERWANGIWGYRLAAFSMAMIATVLTASMTWGYAERKLWETGQFGEPPLNRYVLVCLKGSEENIRDALFEFGVFEYPITGFNLGVYVGDGYDKEKTYFWADPAGALQPKDSVQAGLGLTVLRDADGKVFKRQHDSMLITPTRSMYAHFTTISPIPFGKIACYFREPHAIDGGFCGEDVRIAWYRAAGGQEQCDEFRRRLDLQALRNEDEFRLATGSR